MHALIDADLVERIGAYRAGRVTLREFARALGVDAWATNDLLRANGIEVAQGPCGETGPDLAAILRSVDQSDPS